MRRLFFISALCLPATALANGNGGCVKGVNVDLTSNTTFDINSVEVKDANINPNDITDAVTDNIGQRK